MMWSESPPIGRVKSDTPHWHDLWVNEYTIAYDDGRPLNVVGIMEVRDVKVVRERIYFGEPWEPPAWRAQWVEAIAEPSAPAAS
jgi:hypothetical protein